MKVIHTFTKEIVLTLVGQELDEAMEALNLHYVGEKNCNEYKEGKLVSKYPNFEKDVPAFPESHYTVRRGNVVKLNLELLEDGSLRIKN
jgi:hypothetical protein